MIELYTIPKELCSPGFTKFFLHLQSLTIKRSRMLKIAKIEIHQIFGSRNPIQKKVTKKNV